MLEIVTRARFTTLLALVAVVCVGLPATSARAETVVSIDEFYVPYDGSSTSCPGCRSLPHDVAVGADGSIWFTEGRGNRIGRFDPSSGEHDYWAVPAYEWVAPFNEGGPTAMVADRDGVLWFVQEHANRLVGFDPVTETFSDYQLDPWGNRLIYSAYCCSSNQMTLGPDGAIWIVLYHTVVRFDPRTRESTFTDISPTETWPTDSWTPQLTGITAGTDGNMYMTDIQGQGIWRIEAAPLNNSYKVFSLRDPSSTPALMLFRFPGTSPLCWRCYQPEAFQVVAVSAGSDGSIWFSASDGWFGRMSPSGEFDLFEVGLRTLGTSMTAGPDGTMWFLGMGPLGEPGGGLVVASIGRIGPNGAITTYPHTWSEGFSHAPHGAIVPGPAGEGELWYADPWGNGIGRVKVGSVAAHGTAITGREPTVANPVQVSVSSATAGSVSIQVRPTDQPAPSGYTFLDHQVDIEAPAGSTDAPLYIEFRIHDSILPPGLDPSSLQVFRNGIAVEACDPMDFAAPDPCVWEKAYDATGMVMRIYTSHASAWNFAIQPPYTFEGFFAPVDNAPTINVAKAGSAIPMRFGLEGDHGLDVLAPGYPQAAAIDCRSGAPLDAIEQTATAGSSGLAYDEKTGRYLYVWKTDSSWAGTCRQFVLKLTDGSTHIAEFSFAK